MRVSFNGRKMVGVIIAAHSYSPSSRKLKHVEELLDTSPILSTELLDSLSRASAYYQAPLGEFLALALPAKLRAGAPLAQTAERVWSLDESRHSELESLRKGRPKTLAKALQQKALSESQMELLMPQWRAALRALVNKQLVSSSDRPPMPQAVNFTPLAVSTEQADVIQAIGSAGTGFSVQLIDGVTGSGKTEVYLHLIAECLKRGKQALVLVPEIGLTPQLLRRLSDRLGVVVHSYHSGLSDAQRAQTWAAAQRGEAQVIVGTRTASMMPLVEPGLLVIDEEHDASFKQQDGVRYHARDLAILRAQALDIPIVMGSATPSLESLQNARSGRYRRHRLKQRANGANAPGVSLVDIRKRRLHDGLGEEAITAIRHALAAGEQVLVFRNRRGYAPALLCGDCGWVASCTECNSSMTIHGRQRALRCHHCGARAQKPDACPQCKGLGLNAQGVGTERLEQGLTELFGEANIVRIDRDTTKSSEGLEKRILSLGDGPGILVGTQMLAKGHDLPKLTLVVVVGADDALFSADFRGSERLGQMLVQVAGRSGRADLPGKVIVQTYQPEHPLLRLLCSRGYTELCEQLLSERELAQLPPFTYLALLRAESPSESEVQAFLDKACALWPNKEIELYGPMPSPMPLRAGRSRAQVLLKCKERPVLQAALRVWLDRLDELKTPRQLRWSLDVDPIDLY